MDSDVLLCVWCLATSPGCMVQRKVCAVNKAVFFVTYIIKLEFSYSAIFSKALPK